MKLMIETVEPVGVNVSTDTETVDIGQALLMLELARMSLLTYAMGGPDEAPPAELAEEVQE